MIEVLLNSGEKLRLTDEEAWAHVRFVLAQLDIGKLGEPSEDAAQRVADAWAEVGLSFGSSPVASVANALDVLCEYSRAVVDPSYTVGGAGTSVGSETDGGEAAEALPSARAGTGAKS